MKVVLTATGNSLDSEIDPRFGRAQYLVLFDTETEEVSPIDNEQNVQAAGGAGVQAAEMIANVGAEVLITGHCGPKAFRALEAAGVKVICGAEDTVKGAVDKFKKGEYTFTDAADVESHW